MATATQGRALIISPQESSGSESQRQPAWDFLKAPASNARSLAGELDRLIYTRQLAADPAIQGAKEEAGILSHPDVQAAFLASMDAFDTWEQSL